jgi:hypothetical protein
LHAESLGLGRARERTGRDRRRGMIGLGIGRMEVGWKRERTTIFWGRGEIFFVVFVVLVIVVVHEGCRTREACRTVCVSLNKVALFPIL